MIIEGNKLTAMLALKYFGGWSHANDEPKLARQMAEAIAVRHNGTVDRVWVDHSAGGWFTEITLRGDNGQS
jgi:hypothetical protein